MRSYYVHLGRSSNSANMQIKRKRCGHTRTENGWCEAHKSQGLLAAVRSGKRQGKSEFGPLALRTVNKYISAVLSYILLCVALCAHVCVCAGEHAHVCRGRSQVLLPRHWFGGWGSLTALWLTDSAWLCGWRSSFLCLSRAGILGMPRYARLFHMGSGARIQVSGQALY